MMTLILLPLGAYLLGSVAFAVLISRLMSLPDPRTFGSKNPGATNMLRGGSKKAAALVLLGDALKGALAIWLVRWLAPGEATVLALSALAVFLGHCYPVFLGFKGGKGVATFMGVVIALNPWLGLYVAATWLSVMALTRISSLSALVSALLAPIYGWFLFEETSFRFALLVMSLLLLIHHHSNIRKLLKGEETVFRS
jgi:glycerol-3-phosphate acyltransferase PlsY